MATSQLPDNTEPLSIAITRRSTVHLSHRSVGGRGRSGWSPRRRAMTLQAAIVPENISCNW
jgi:hypothetical protein